MLEKLHYGAVAVAAAALFFCLPSLTIAVSPSVDDELSTPLVERIMEAQWAERLLYPVAPDDTRTPEQRVSQEVAFSEWLARNCDGPTSNSLIEAEVQKHRRELMIAELRERMTAYARQSLSEEEIHRYAEHYKWNIPSVELHEVGYIFIEVPTTASAELRQSAEARAHEIRERTTLANFPDMAREFSDAPSADEGGAMGLLDLNAMGPTFSSHARQTSVGQVGGPYPTKSGWNIILLRSIHPSVPREAASDLRGAAAAAHAALEIQQVSQTTGALEQLLQREGLSEAPLIEGEVQAMQSYMIARQCVSDRAGALTTPTEAQLTELFAETSASLTLPERRHAREIVARTAGWNDTGTTAGWIARRASRNEASRLRKMILAGDDFTSVARAHSVASSAQRGGDLGWITKPSGYLVDTALDALKAGEISPPLYSPQGYVLFQLVAEEPAKPMTFDQARPRLEQIWRTRQAKDISRKLQEEWLKNSDAKTQNRKEKH